MTTIITRCWVSRLSRCATCPIIPSSLPVPVISEWMKPNSKIINHIAIAIVAAVCCCCCCCCWSTYNLYVAIASSHWHIDTSAVMAVIKTTDSQQRNLMIALLFILFFSSYFCAWMNQERWFATSTTTRRIRRWWAIQWGPCRCPFAQCPIIPYVIVVASYLF